FNFAQTQMAVVVADDFAEALKLAFGHRGEQTFFAERFNQAFRENDEAVLRAFGFALDDGADDDVANFVHRDGATVKFLGNDGERGGGGLADAEREMPRRAAHADDEIPARGRARVFHQVADKLHAVMPRGFVAERRRGAGKRQIVVNGLGNVRDLDFAVAAFADDAGGKSRVVAADGDERGDAELVKHGE